MRQRAYLSVCTVFRNESAYLAEWIEFHRLVGVEHFLLYDDQSSDSGRAVLEPWVRAGVVTLTECRIPSARGGQTWAYDDALKQARGLTRWLAFVDVDEFLFSPEHALLTDVLRDYECHPGVVINWQVYGSAGLETKPPGLVIESFVHRASTNWVRNRRVKSIVDPARAVRAKGAHFFEYEHDSLAATENHEPVQIVQSPPSVRRLKTRLQRLAVVETDPFAIHHSSVTRISVRRLRINHYAVKSRQEFAAKIDRHSPKRSTRLASRYFTYHDRNEVHDPILVRYAPQLQSRLKQIRC